MTFIAVGVPARAHGATTTVSAVGDTYVNQEFPTKNYRRAHVLRLAGRAKRCAADRCAERRALIRFWLPPLAGQPRAVTLRAYTTRGRSQSLEVRAARCAYDNANVTWRTRPRMGARLAIRRRSIANAYNGWTLPAGSIPAAGGPVCLYVRTVGRARVDLGSWNRDAAHAPRLVVKTPPPSPAPSAPPATGPATGSPAARPIAADLATDASLKPTKFVSPSGSDGGSCSQAAPCRTLTRADRVASPGDVVSIADGTYDGGVLTTSGTSAARITYVAEHSWGASVRSLLDVRGAYVDVRNLDVTGATAGGLAINASYSRAIHNHIHDLPLPCGTGTGLWAGNGNDQPAYSSHGQELLYNVVNDIGPPGGWTAGSCQLTHGIYASVPDVKIVGNLVYRTIGDGITSWHAASNLTVVNNTVVGAGSDGILIGNGDGGGSSAGNTGSYVANNIAVRNFRHGITESGTASGNAYRNNLTSGNQWDCVSCSMNSKDESGTLSSDPQFSGGDDFHLQAASPAVDSGTPTGAPPSDLDGNPRPLGAGVDRGADER